MLKGEEKLVHVPLFVPGEVSQDHQLSALASGGHNRGNVLITDSLCPAPAWPAHQRAELSEALSADTTLSQQ